MMRAALNALDPASRRAWRRSSSTGLTTRAEAEAHPYRGSRIADSIADVVGEPAERAA